MVVVAIVLVSCDGVLHKGERVEVGGGACGGEGGGRLRANHPVRQEEGPQFSDFLDDLIKNQDKGQEAASSVATAQSAVPSARV